MSPTSTIVDSTHSPRPTHTSAPLPTPTPDPIPAPPSTPVFHILTPARPLASILHLWHLLSLDAPTVATLWMALIAHAAAVALPPATLPATFLAVWLLYVADRLLDARALSSHPHPHSPASLGLEPRHLFHHAHRRAFLAALVLVSAVLVLLVPRLSPAALRLDLLLGTLLLAYFLLIHAPRRASRLPKEIAVGLFFSAAVFLPTVALRPALRLSLAPVAVLFAVLCSLNCIAIYAWEHPAPNRQPHPLTRLGVAHLTPALVTLLLVALALAALTPVPAPPLAIALAALLLLVLHHLHHRVSPLTLRALADLALTTPILFLLRH